MTDEIDDESSELGPLNGLGDDPEPVADSDDAVSAAQPSVEEHDVLEPTDPKTVADSDSSESVIAETDPDSDDPEPAANADTETAETTETASNAETETADGDLPAGDGGAIGDPVPAVQPGVQSGRSVQADPPGDEVEPEHETPAEPRVESEDEREWPPEPRPPRRGESVRFVAMIGLAAVLFLALFAWGCSRVLSNDDADTDGSGAESIAAEATVAPTTVEEAESPGEVVVIARPEWDSGWFQAELTAALIRELGYTVTEPSALEHRADSVYPSMARGEVDLWAHAWLPGHDRFIDLDRITVTAAQVEGGGPKGLLVSKDWAESNGVQSMEDVLANPSLRADVDLDGDGVVDILGCEAQWRCFGELQNLIEANGWQAAQQANRHEFHIQAMEQRLDIGQPTIIFAWGPDGMLDRLGLGEKTQWLSTSASIPEFDLDAQTVSAAVPAGHCSADPCVSPFDHDEIHAAANTEFLNAHPDIAGLLTRIQIPAADIWAQNQRMAEGESSNEDVLRHAMEWLAANRDLADAWVAN